MKTSCLRALLIVILFEVSFVNPAIASISITSNGDSGEQNVDVPVESNPNGISNTITANGDSGDQNVDVSNNNDQNGGSVSITNTVSSNNAQESNSSSPTTTPPTAIPSKTNNSLPNQLVGNSPTVKPSVSPSPFVKPTASIVPRVNKPKQPLMFFSRIWKGLASSIANFFHWPPRL